MYSRIGGNNSNMKYYSFETITRSLKDSLKRFLLNNNIYFEILTDANGVEMINNFLDNNTI